MEKPAHILTERQKKGSLSTVKKAKQPKNVILKNEIEYWPSLNEKQSEEFVKLLETFCNGGADNVNLISLGMNSTLRNLKKQNEVEILAIADEISPKFLGKHLIAMALHRNHNIKIVIVPKLKDITRQLMKAPSIIFTIKKSSSGSKFEEFYESLGIRTELLKHYFTVRPTVDVLVKKRKVKQSPSDEPPVILLRKPSDNTRSFVPMDDEESTLTANKSTSSDFISLSQFKISSSLVKTPVPLYRQLKIAKIAGNANRKQRKS